MNAFLRRVFAGPATRFRTRALERVSTVAQLASGYTSRCDATELPNHRSAHCAPAFVAIRQHIRAVPSCRRKPILLSSAGGAEVTHSVRVSGVRIEVGRRRCRAAGNQTVPQAGR